MNDDITIVLTSCGRYKLLKKTIQSLSRNIDLGKFRKIMSEDSKNEKFLKKIEHENKKGFLKGWEIIYAKGSHQNESYKSHFFAIKKLYESINTDYVFHLEDDWYFDKVDFDFLEISKKILLKYKDIGIVLLRNYKKDGGLESSIRTPEERYRELFLEEKVIVEGRNFVFMNSNDSTHGFTLNPGLRRTEEMKSIIFDGDSRIDEELYGERFLQKGLRSVSLQPGFVRHIGGGIHSTSLNNIMSQGLLNGVKNIFIQILYNSFRYRLKLLLRMLGFERLLSHEVKQRLFLKIMESPFGYPIDFLLGKYRSLWVPEVDASILNNIEGIEELNIPREWFMDVKPLGISGVARLKNSDDFLEEIIESYIPYLDEIILVNNLSTDKTEEICRKLLGKYPDKIKYFEYPYALGGYVGDKDYPKNSLYSLAYYYNWCFSKSRYKYVMKLDDDNLPIDDKWRKIRNYIMTKTPNTYCIYWGLNIVKKGNDYGVFRKEIYSGSGGDHGIYPVGSKTYYIQRGIYERFSFGLRYKRFGFSFLHLKYLKEKKGQININARFKSLFINADDFLNNFLNILSMENKKIISNFFKKG